MKKIMFDDRFGLTKAVLEGRKTMTRRIIDSKTSSGANDYVQRIHGTGLDFLDYFLEHSRYEVGEVVAIARSYAETLKDPNPRINRRRKEMLRRSPGWTNKMFVLAELMTYRIRITSVYILRLQDISDEDCLREGIYRKTCCPPGDIDYFYHSEPRSKNEVYPTPRAAFAGLIDKVSGKGTWARNPWVYVYEIELVK